ncbi:hemolysin [Vibrio astriarenae]|nr:hemolysin [Vibrio sp. C7]
MNVKMILMGIGLGALVSGCADVQDKYDVGEYTAVSNPASVYCVEQEGELVMVTEAGKRVTYCKLSDDEMVEQWNTSAKTIKKKKRCNDD